MHKRPISLTKLRQVPQQFSWVDQRLGRERYINQLSHEACTLSLFLVTVADAQGLSFYSEQSLCQRLSMTPAILRHARQALIKHALVAYECPLYQVLALDGDARRPTAELASLAGDNEPVDLKAVFKHIWEVLSGLITPVSARSNTSMSSRD
jgi:hypothetical protein